MRNIRILLGNPYGFEMTIAQKTNKNNISSKYDWFYKEIHIVLKTTEEIKSNKQILPNNQNINVFLLRNH